MSRPGGAPTAGVNELVRVGTGRLGAAFALAADFLCSGKRTGLRRERLVVFSRFPEPGKTKTRLIPALGAGGAAELQRRMAEHTLRRARHLAAGRGVSLEVRFDGGSRGLMQRWLGADLAYRLQGAGDLGERMARALRDAFRAGVQAAVIVGTDCPGLSVDIMETAFDALTENDLVLGPATDGGYYLIGLRGTASEVALRRIFEGVKWGTSEVLDRTLGIAGEIGISSRLLPPLDDVDRPEDLAAVESELAAVPGDADPIRISVIIPTLNEVECVGSALASVRAGSNVEIIVADGGSGDGTASLARSRGAKVVVSRRGRAKQLNAGAAVAAGEALLFLHADTRLPEGFDAHVRRALARPGVVGGAFELRIDSELNSLRRIEKLANWRSRRLGTPFGDQGLFVRADVFRRMGGFPDVPLMEDLDFVLRLRRKGRIEIVPAPAVTSSRRWMKRGVLRATLSNQLAIWAYFLGVPPSQIARWYPRRAVRTSGGPDLPG